MRLIITEKQYNIISETIRPNQAYNHLDSLKTVMDGSRNVGFFGGTTSKELNWLINSGLKFIEIGFNNAYVFYNDVGEKEANELANIAKKNRGFLPTIDAEETRRIGQLLGYDMIDVNKFVKNKFKIV